MKSRLNIGLACAFVFLASSTFGRTEPPWFLVQTPVFTIVSQASEKETRQWAVDLEQFRRGLQTVTGVSEEFLMPATVVIFRRDRDFEPFKPRRSDGSHKMVAGYFMTRGDHGLLVFSTEHEDENMRRIIFHEGTHWFLHSVSLRWPGWLDEGLAEVFSTFAVEDDYIYIGRSIDNHIFFLHQASLMPVEALVGTNRQTLPYDEDTRTGLFYAQSWLLMHYLIFGEKSANVGRLGSSLMLFRDEKNPDKAFEQAFGCDYHAMDQRLNEYSRYGRFFVWRIPASKEDLSRDITIGPASAADVAIALGNLMAGVGDDAQAKIYLDRAAAAAPGDPRVLEINAQQALRNGRHDEAVSIYEQAAAAGSKNFHVWLFLAQHYMRIAGIYNNFAMADPGKIRKAADDYEQAIKLSPLYPGIYRQLAETMGVLVQYSPADGEFLRKGLGLVPDDTMMTVGLAAWEINNGQADAGCQRLETLLNSNKSLDTASRTYAKWLLAQRREADDERRVGDLLRQGKTDEASAVIDDLVHKSMSSAKRADLLALRAKVGRLEILQRARQLVGDHQPELAKALLDDLLDSKNLDPDTRTQAQALQSALK